MTSTSEQADGGGDVIRCERLVVGFGGRGLLPPIDLELRTGSFVAVIGRNGSGKSTWLKTVLGLLHPVSGRVAHSSSLRAAYVPQVSTIDPLLPLRARDVVAWGRLTRWSFLRSLSSSEDREVCERALARVGATDLAPLAFRQLSEGQKQRVLLARLLASEPDLAVLDEPTSAMDPRAEVASIEALAELSRERGTAVVIVSHRFDLVAQQADQALFLDREHGAVRWGAARDVFDDAEFRSHFGEVVRAH